MTRLLLAVAMGLFGFAGITGVAEAQPTCTNTNAGAQDDACTNNGDAEGSVDQSGSASSGDGVAGQVVGVVSAGDASVDATNRSSDVTVTTGDATATNVGSVEVTAGVFKLGPLGSIQLPITCTNTNAATGAQSDACANNGDAEGGVDQTAESASGDGVAGQVVGVVTSAGGSADLVLDNESSDSSVDSGSADFTNTGTVFSDAVVFDVGP